jgi:hypothetical protein
MRIPPVALPIRGSDARAMAVYRLSGDDRHAGANAKLCRSAQASASGSRQSRSAENRARPGSELESSVHQVQRKDGSCRTSISES